MILMRSMVWAPTLVLLLLVPHSATAQAGAAAADSAALAAAGQEAGVRDGGSASLKGAIWGSAAATFFLTPFVGGLGSLILSQASAPSPPAIPSPAAETHGAAYQHGYTAGYQATYGPRYRKAVRRSVLVTSIIFFGSMVALGG